MGGRSAAANPEGAAIRLAQGRPAAASRIAHADGANPGTAAEGPSARACRVQFDDSRIPAVGR